MLKKLRDGKEILKRMISLQREAQSFRTLSHFSFKDFTIKKKSSKIWMNEHVNDPYVKKAQLVFIFK